jgi:hypothetical protein
MLNIKKQLYNDIVLYCKANNIVDIEKFTNDLLEKAFVSEKYGATPQIPVKKEVEKIIEKPLVYNPENVVSLPNEEQPKLEPITEEVIEPIKPQKVFKKINLNNDDYKVYDNL